MRRLLTSLTLCLLSLPALAAGGFNQDNFGRPGFSQYVSVAAPSTPLIQPLMASFTIPASTGNRFTTPIGTTGSGGTATTNIRGIPVPVATTISGLYANVPASTAGGTVSDYIIPSSGTGAAGVNTCSLVSAANCDYTGAGDALNPGDTLEVLFTASTAWTTGAGQYSLLSTPTDGVSGFFGTMASTGTLSANQYAGMGVFSQTATANSTEADASTIVTAPFTLTGIFVDPNGTVGSTSETVTVCKNGTSSCSTPTSGMFCTLTAGTAGCCATSTVLTGAHEPRSATACSNTSIATIHFALNDTISVQFSCATAGSCTSINPGVSLSYTSDTAGQSFLTAQPYGNITATSFAAMHDYQVLTTQSNWNMLPYMNSKTAHFSLLDLCSDTNSGGTATRTFTAQLGASPGTAPSALAGASAAQLSVANGACTGANSATLLGGNQDTSDTWTATAGETIDYTQTIGGSPATGNHTYKLSIVTTVK